MPARPKRRRKAAHVVRWRFSGFSTHRRIEEQGVTRWSYPVGDGATVIRDPASAVESHAEAAVLVVDVSGFTALTAKLEVEHGRRAADRLAVVMDELLG